MAELIKNCNEDEWCTQQSKFCTICTNRGIIKIPVEEDMEKYEKLVEKYDNQGCFNLSECKEKALKMCKYNTFYCPNCEKGMKYKNQFERYEIKGN